MLILIGFCAAFAILAAYITNYFLSDKTGFGPVALAVVLGIAVSLIANWIIAIAMDLTLGFDFFIPAVIGSVLGPLAMPVAARRARRKPLADDDLRR